MKHTECEDCKLRNGDCGYHFKMNGKTYYDIPSLSACDRYGDCEFFQQKEIPKGDLISREALKEAIEQEYNKTLDGIVKFGIEKAYNLIDNAPTVLFPLTVKIKDNVTDEDKEVFKRLMEDYKPQVLNLETERPQGEWIPVEERLPEEMQTVLVWFEYYRYGDFNCMFPTYGFCYVCDGKWSPFINGETGWTNAHIIAWMPLPEPYSSEVQHEDS